MMTSLSVALAVALLGFLRSTASAAGDDHVEHVEHVEHEDHDEHELCPWTKAWEWAALFHVEDGGSISWNAEKALATGEYADESMKLVILSASSASAAGLESAEEDAEKAWNGTWTTAQPGTTLSPGNAYILRFDTDSWVSHFKITAAAESNLVFFAQHHPEEFENKLHYLIAADGNDLEPVAVESVKDCAATTSSAVSVAHSQRWGEVIGASLLTVLPTLLGIAFMTCALSPSAVSKATRCVGPVSSAASGVVFAAAVFLLLPEALLMISAGLGEEAAAAAWGSAILVGWLMGVFIDHACSLFSYSFFKGGADAQHDHGGAATATVSAEDAVISEEKPVKSLEMARSSMSIAGPVIFGDMFHNLTDGFVIGAAFKSCDASFAFKIAAVTTLHEVPQELADFLVLVNKAGMTWKWATFFNFLSGLATLVGAIVAHSVEVPGEIEGIILAAGAGIYIYVAATELGPSVAHLSLDDSGSPFLASISKLLAFALGATVIGLVLLDHQHCSGPAISMAGEAVVDPHAGHGH